MKVVVISDPHGRHNDIKLPKGDVLVCAGDMSGRGAVYECRDFIEWFECQDYDHKILIAGNHDFCFERSRLQALELLNNTSIHYLENEAVTIDGVKFYGSPVTPWFHNWAFNVDRGPDIQRYWDKIHPDTDVLITHGPPKGILDRSISGESCGCDDLYNAIERINPKYHVFGHIHEGYGVRMSNNPNLQTTFINASVLNEQYRLRNKPIEFEVTTKN